jgi:hypothetical protein
MNVLIDQPHLVDTPRYRVLRPEILRRVDEQARSSPGRGQWRIRRKT